jgi:signal transduction histidine kinase
VNSAALELALTNYVSNAIKYSDADAGERWVEVNARVEPAERQGGATRLVIEVKDNGLGVPEEKREQLFTRFFRAHGDTVTGVEGTGLGLSIVRETVEGLGGRAWAEFEGPRGSRFYLSLPYRRTTDRASAGQTTAETA